MDSRTETPTPGEMRERLIAKADADEAFRARLLSDPKAAVNEELGLAIPPGFTIEVHEDAADTSHLVLPPSAALGEARPCNRWQAGEVPGTTKRSRSGTTSEPRSGTGPLDGRPTARRPGKEKASR